MIDTYSNAYRLQCLARHYLRTYPEKLRRHEAFDRYRKQHGEQAPKEPAHYVSTETNAYRVYAALYNETYCYANFLKWLNKPISSTGLETSAPAQAQLLPAPWWTHVPWLAPAQETNHAH